jgi:tetratricopeptide (TPR) repeat protein
LVGGRFEVAAFVGEGGMGAVYRAIDRQTGETVALKHVRATADGENRFFREARALALLSHPAIVRYVAHGTAQGGEAYLAMEWLEGRTLRSRLAEGALEVDEVVDLARRVSGALSHAHSHGIVHRDLNPMNLLLVGGRVDGVKVLDFGLARHRGDRAETTGPMTGPIGTMGYMAPEQARGMTDIDARADLFSLGAVLFECLTGQPAFGSDNYLAVLAKIVVAPAPRVRDVAADAPMELDALVAELLTKDRDERPASADAVLDALASLKGSRPTLSAPSTNESMALTSQERTLVSVIVCTGAERESGATAARAIAERHGLSAEPLAGRGLVLTSSGTGAATDQAARAARAALELASTLAASRIALATGWAMVAGSSATGAVVERAAELLRRSSDGRVRIDDVTLGLLSPRFEVTGDGGELVLVSRRDDARPVRLLLGRSAGCYGREREQRTLHALLDECVEEPMAQAILLTGPAGVGKSRVRFELLAQLPERHPALETWVGRGDPMRAGSSFSILASALRRTLGVTETEDPAVQRRKIAARVARHVPEAERERVAEFLAELIGAGEADTTSPRLLAARQDTVMMGDSMREAVVSFLQAECTDHPVLVVLEDFQWGDAATAKVVDTALRQLAGLPFAVLAIARQDVHEQFPNLWSEREIQEIRVGALTRRAAESMVRDALPECDAAAVEQIVQRAAGNAFYLEELIRAQADGRGAALPETVLGMVKERIESMEPEARRVLRAASIYGQSFHAAGVAALLGGESVRAEVSDWLDTLEQREVVTRRAEGEPSAEPAFAFRHALVRDAAYAMLTDEDRTLGHRLAAAYLSSSGVRDSVLLAELYERGGAADEALDWWHRAVSDALDANDFDAALARAERGEKLCRAPADRAPLELARAEALRLRGDAARAAQVIAEAVRDAPEGSAIWCNAVGERALILQRLGDSKQLAAAARELGAARVPPQHDDALALARARTAHGDARRSGRAQRAAASQHDAARPTDGRPRARPRSRLGSPRRPADPLPQRGEHRRRALRDDRRRSLRARAAHQHRQRLHRARSIRARRRAAQRSLGGRHQNRRAPCGCRRAPQPRVGPRSSRPLRRSRGARDAGA